MTRNVAGAGVFVILACVGWLMYSHSSPDSTSSTRPVEERTRALTLTPAAQAQAPTAGQWGNVKGQLVFAGDNVPARNPINMGMNQDKEHCLGKGPLLDEEWVVNKDNKGVRWALVWLTTETGKSLSIHPDLKEIKVKEVVMDQPCCAFIPHALGLRAGQDLVVKNSSPVHHNVNWGGNPLVNLGGNILIRAGDSHTIKDLAPDKLPVRVSCQLHPWMNAKVGVFDHPYFAVTDENGNFEIKQAPAGDWRLVVWHEGVGWRGGAAGRKGEKITVKNNDTTDLGKLELRK